MVGFTGPSGKSDSKALEVAFRRPSKSIQTVGSEKVGAEVTTFRGRLLMADERNPQSARISIVDARRHLDQSVTVPEGMMADVVRPLWGSEVVATCSMRGTQRAPKATLISIQRAGDENADKPTRGRRKSKRRRKSD